MNTKNEIFIYNPIQCNKFLQEGCKLLRTGIHKKSKKTFYVFENNDNYKLAFQKWCDNKNK